MFVLNLIGSKRWLEWDDTIVTGRATFDLTELYPGNNYQPFMLFYQVCVQLEKNLNMKTII